MSCATTSAVVSGSTTATTEVAKSLSCVAICALRFNSQLVVDVTHPGCRPGGTFGRIAYSARVNVPTQGHNAAVHRNIYPLGFTHRLAGQRILNPVSTVDRRGGR